MSNDITLKISIDGKEAIATLKLTDDNVKELYKSFKYGQQEVNGFTTAMSRGFNNAREILQGVREVFQVFVSSFGAAHKAYQEAESASVKLSQALKTQGIYSEKLVNDIKAYAAERRKATGIDDDATIAIAGQFTAMGLQGDALRMAINSAQDLSVAMGTDLQTAARLVGNTLKDGGEELKRYGFTLDAIAGQAEAFGSSTAGAMKKMDASLSDLRETIGGAVSHTISPFVSTLSNIVATLNDLNPQIVGIAGTIGMTAAAMVTLRTMGLAPAIVHFAELKAALIATSVNFRIAAISGQGFAGAMTSLRMSLQALFASIGPGGWILLGLSAVVALAPLFSGANKELSESAKNLLTEKEKVGQLTAVVKDSTQSLTERKAALQEIQKIYPEYLQGINLEKISQEELEKKIQASNRALEKQIQIKILNEQYEAALRKKVEAEEKMKNPSPGILDYVTAVGEKGRVSPEESARLSAQEDYNEAAAEAEKIWQQITALQKQSTPEVKQQTGLLKEIDDEIKRLQEARPLAKTVAEIRAIDTQIKNLTEKKNNIELRVSDSGMLADIDRKIESLKKQRALAGTEQQIVEIDRQLASFEAKKRTIEINVIYASHHANAPIQPMQPKGLEKIVAPPKEKLPEEEAERRKIQLERDEFKRQRDLATFEYRTQKKKYGDLKLLRDEYDAQMAAIDAAERARNKEVAQAKVAATIDALNYIGGAVAQHTVLGKAAAVANATMSTYEAAAKALTAGPILGPILAGIITALGLANVSKILGVKEIAPMRFAQGDIVPGTGNSDSVPALLTPGEFIVRKEIAEKNYSFLRALNAGLVIPRYASGGVVGGTGATDGSRIIEELKREIRALGKKLTKMKNEVVIQSNFDIQQYHRADKKLQRTRAAFAL